MSPRPTPPAEASLDQALAWPGPAREATAAHPHCTCTRCRHRDQLCAKGSRCSLAADRCLMHGSHR